MLLSGVLTLAAVCIFLVSDTAANMFGNKFPRNGFPPGAGASFPARRVEDRDLKKGTTNGLQWATKGRNRYPNLFVRGQDLTRFSGKRKADSFQYIAPRTGGAVSDQAGRRRYRRDYSGYGYNQGFYPGGWGPGYGVGAPVGDFGRDFGSDNWRST